MSTIFLSIKRSLFRKQIALSLLFITSVLFAFYMRSYHYEREAQSVTDAVGYAFIPFTIESAMMYSYTKDVALGDGISDYDKSLIGMEKYRVKDQFSVGLEYFLGYGYRIKKAIFGASSQGVESGIFEDSKDFSDWIRFQIRLWTSLTTGLVFLWLIVARCPWYFALGGAFLHAVSPAAIARYTGQDLVRGQFALPLLVASFVIALWAFRRLHPLKLVLLGVVVFLALSAWDMCQIVFAVWGVAELCRILAGGVLNRKRLKVWATIFVASVLVALLVPYHRTHWLLVSPLVFIILPSIITLYCVAFAKKISYLPSSPTGGIGGFIKRLVVVLTLLAALVAVWKITTMFSGFSGSYGHFGELLKAKLAFNNVKPADPRLLNFDARILWTPEMHSATWALTKTYFPSIMAIFTLLLLPLAPFVNVGNLSCGFFASHSSLQEGGVYGKVRVVTIFFIALCSLVLSLGICFLLFERLLLWPEVFIKLMEAEIPETARDNVSFIINFGRWIAVLAFSLLVFVPFLGIRRELIRRSGASFLPVFMALFYSVGFIYIVRYYVFSILFMSIAVPLLAWHWFKAARVPSLKKLLSMEYLTLGYKGQLGLLLKGLLLVLAISVLFFDMNRSFSSVRNYGFNYLKETAALVGWFRLDDAMKDQGVLADMGLSPVLKAYTGAEIVLQPKFEIGRTRELVEQYTNLLFNGTEEGLNRFCVEHGIDYFVYDRGNSYYAPLHIYSNRYIAAAIRPKKDSPAFVMYGTPDACKWFYRIETPSKLRAIDRKYTVFKVISPEDKMNSIRLAMGADMAFKVGDIVKAKSLVRRAFQSDPSSEDAYVLYYKVYGKIPKLKLHGM